MSNRQCVVCDKFINHKGNESWERFFLRIRHKKCEGKPNGARFQKSYDEYLKREKEKKDKEENK